MNLMPNIEANVDAVRERLRDRDYECAACYLRAARRMAESISDCTAARDAANRKIDAVARDYAEATWHLDD